MRTNTITLALSIMASLGSSSVPAQEENQDEVHPALLHPFWLGLSPLAAPYTLTEADREKFGGSFGVDLSHYSFDIANSDPKCKTQSGYTDPSCSCTINWEILSDNKLRYVYMKATDGAAVDLSFPRFWSELEPKHASNLLFRGAYHFLRPGVDPEKQANTFLRAIGAIDGRKPAQLPPVLDIEWSNKRVKPGTREFKACPKNRLVKNDKGIYYCDMWFRVSSAGIAAMAKEWIDKVERGTGRPVIIYTNPTGWWNPVMEDSGEELMKKQAVWTSRYTSAGPQYDSKWTGEGGSPQWNMAPLPRGASYPSDEYNIPHFWQFSANGYLPLNIFTCSGNLEARAMDMNWVPVSASEYPALFGVAQR